MSAPTLIALDAGTTGVTAVLYDADLAPLHRAYRELPQSFPRPGRVEHDCRAILDAVDATLGELLARPEAAEVAALGITNQRETVFAMDPGIDEALRPGIVWQDRRTAERCAELRAQGHAERIHERTGLVVDPYFSATKIEWWLTHDPDLRERAEGGGVVFCTVDAMIVQHLTEQEVCATDPTNASRTMLYDIDRRAWDPELCELFGVQLDWLPEVRPSCGDFGTTSRYVLGREIPIRGIAGDQQSALFGQGCFERGTSKCTFGTGSFLVLNTGSERVDSQRGVLTTLAVGRDGRSVYAMEGSAFVCGALVQWLRDELGWIETAADSERLARSVEDSAGVHVVPAFAGLGAPYWDADARGAILGLTRGTTPAHVTRAALEAIAFQNAELVELLREDSGLAIDALLADGGACANDLLMQMQADFAQLAVERPAELDATARGAALLAGLAAGLWSDPGEPAALAGARERIEPVLAPELARERMAGWRGAVARVRSTGA